MGQCSYRFVKEMTQFVNAVTKSVNSVTIFAVTAVTVTTLTNSDKSLFILSTHESYDRIKVEICICSKGQINKSNCQTKIAEL